MIEVNVKELAETYGTIIGTLDRDVFSKIVKTMIDQGLLFPKKVSILDCSITLQRAVYL